MEGSKSFSIEALLAKTVPQKYKTPTYSEEEEEEESITDEMTSSRHPPHDRDSPPRPYSRQDSPGNCFSDSPRSTPDSSVCSQQDADSRAELVRSIDSGSPRSIQEHLLQSGRVQGLGERSSGKNIIGRGFPSAMGMSSGAHGGSGMGLTVSSPFYSGYNGIPTGQTSLVSNPGHHGLGQGHHHHQHPGAAALSMLAGSAFHSPGSSGGLPPGADPTLRLAQAQAAAHMQSLQLDWLARAGVYMPRIIDYNGELIINIIHFNLSFFFIHFFTFFFFNGNTVFTIYL